MKKYILASAISLLAMASVAFAADSTVSPRPMASPKPVVNGACMASAVDKRDSAIISAVDSYSSSVKSALSTRRNDLKAAWGKTNVKDVRIALKAAWDSYRSLTKKARSDFNGARRDAWAQFKTDSRACKPSVDEGDNQGADAQL